MPTDHHMPIHWHCHTFSLKSQTALYTVVWFDQHPASPVQPHPLPKRLPLSSTCLARSALCQHRRESIWLQHSPHHTPRTWHPWEPAKTAALTVAALGTALDAGQVVMRLEWSQKTGIWMVFGDLLPRLMSKMSMCIICLIVNHLTGGKDCQTCGESSTLFLRTVVCLIFYQEPKPQKRICKWSNWH